MYCATCSQESMDKFHGLISIDMRHLLLLFGLFFSTLVLPNRCQALSVSYTTDMPSPQSINNAITINATGLRGQDDPNENILYRFRVGYQVDGVWTWTTLQDYSTDSNVVWTPTSAYKWTISIWTKFTNSPNAYDAACSGYFITCISNDNITFTATPNPCIVNQTVSLNANINTQGQYQYWFRVGYQDAIGWHWTDLIRYVPESNCNWTPTEARRYTVAVYVRTLGSPNTYDAYKSMYFFAKVNNVFITCNPLPRQSANTTITITATPGCSGNIEYLFKVRYQQQGIYHWTIIRDYGNDSACQWTPTEPYNYLVVVYARTVGDGSAYDSYASSNYLINSPPVGYDDTTAGIYEDPPFVQYYYPIDALANDEDPDNDNLMIDAITGYPQHGEAYSDGFTIYYQPDRDYFGPDTLEYRVSDGYGGFDTATINITVLPVNDPPIAYDDSPQSITEDSTLFEYNVLSNDIDIDGPPLSITSTTNGTNGKATISNNKVTYKPNDDWFGTDTFTYTITDGEYSDSATVTIQVLPVNDPPIAVDDATTCNEDTTATNINVLANDIDIDNTHDRVCK